MKSFLKSDYGILLGLIAIVIIMPYLLINKYYTSVLIFIAINTIVAVGLSLLVCHAGQISLGHAGFYGIGAYTSAVLCTRYNIPVWGAVAISVVLASVLAWIVGAPTLKLKGHYLAVATLGLGVIAHIVFVEWDTVTMGPSGIVGIPSLTFFGKTVTGDLQHYYLFWAVAIIIILIAINIVRSRVGRALRALHGSEVAAASMGVNISGYKAGIFVISAAFAALGGCFYAHYVTFISPTGFGLGYSILILTMIIIGGAESIWGAVIGAALLTTLPELLRTLKDYDVVVYGFVLMVVLIFMPTGIVGGLKMLYGKIRRPKSAE